MNDQRKTKAQLIAELEPTRGRIAELAPKQADEGLHDLIEIIQFTEHVSAKLHGLLSGAEIYRTVREEFAQSKQYSASILLLTDDDSSLRIAEASLSPAKVKAGEKATGLRLKGYKIDLKKSSIYRQVVSEGKTVQVNVSDIIGELFPRPLAHLIVKTIGYEKKSSILTPLKRHGKIIGALAMAPPELAEHFIPSVRNLAQHISNALEWADEYTDRKRLEAEMLRAAKLESLGVMARGLAHDFNNFLMSIMLNVGTARLKASGDKEIQDLLQAAEQSIQKAKGITQQLLTFTRSGEPVKSSKSLQPIIKESVKFTLHGSKIMPRFDLPEDLWPVKIDPDQINQVINSLALNAVQAMPRGGYMTVTARNVTIEEGDHRTALQPGNYVEVAVKDEGVGIPPESIDSIFDPYYTTREGGTGLGLFSLHSIIERHGGWITVESEVDQGTTFTFYLPAAAGEEAAAISSEIKKGSGRVLVMDDDDTICLGLKALLGELGYEAETTADGEEALERYAEALKSDQPFDAVILDLTVPGGMGGAEAIERLRELDPRVRAVVSSGYATDPIMANYQEYGFKAVLPKPFQPTDLSRAMDQVLG